MFLVFAFWNGIVIPSRVYKNIISMLGIMLQHTHIVSTRAKSHCTLRTVPWYLYDCGYTLRAYLLYPYDECGKFCTLYRFWIKITMRKFYECIPIVAPVIPSARSGATMPRLSGFVEKPEVNVDIISLYMFTSI